MTSRQIRRALVATALIVVLTAIPILLEPLRLLFAVAFCLLVPGSGWAYRTPAADLADKIALAMVISLSATILVSTAMVATDMWSAPGALAILAVFAVLGYFPLGRNSRGLTSPPAD